MQIKQKAKKVSFKGKDLWNKVLKTLSDLDEIVGVTLGPGGNPVLIERPGSSPLMTKDGVTVAESISFHDAEAYVIAETAKEVCQRTNNQAGDGTTTAIVLAYAIVKKGIEYLENTPSKSPQQLCRELDVIANEIAIRLKNKSKAIEPTDLKKVALVSSNFDDEIASAVIQAIKMAGEDGTVITEESSGRGTTVEEQDGYTLQKGLSSFREIQEIYINDLNTQECVYDRPYILLYNGDLREVPEIGAYLGECLMFMQEEEKNKIEGGGMRPIIVVAHKFSNQVLRFLAQNAKVGVASLCPLETFASPQPNSKHYLLQDLAAWTDATIIDPIENTFQKIRKEGRHLEILGQVEKSRIGRYRSVLLGFPAEQRIKDWSKTLKSQMKTVESDYDREFVKERIGRLTGGIATIRVGGDSDLEVREKVHRIDDAINATRSAIEMGIVAGGGSSYLMISHELSKLLEEGKLGLPDSARILCWALAVPFSRIMTNAGHSEKDIETIITTVLESQGKMAYDSLSHKLVDPFKAGIIDPLKVSISAFINAVSIAKMLMTIGGAVTLPRDEMEERQAEAQAQAFNNQMSTVK